MTIEQAPIDIDMISNLLAFIPYFSSKKSFGKWEGGKQLDGTYQMPYVVYDQKVHEFRTLLYESGFMVVFDWGSWDEGREIASDPARVSDVDLLTVRMLMTAIVRNDRFCEGAFLSAIQDGLIAAILKHLQTLIKENKIRGE